MNNIPNSSSRKLLKNEALANNLILLILVYLFCNNRKYIYRDQESSNSMPLKGLIYMSHLFGWKIFINIFLYYKCFFIRNSFNKKGTLKAKIKYIYLLDCRMRGEDSSADAFDI